MRKIILQITAVLVFKATGHETKTFKKMKAAYLEEKEEWKKKAAALQAELDREHKIRFGWDSTSERNSVKKSAEIQ